VQRSQYRTWEIGPSRPRKLVGKLVESIACDFANGRGIEGDVYPMHYSGKLPGCFSTKLPMLIAEAGVDVVVHLEQIATSDLYIINYHLSKWEVKTYANVSL
jgi:hypothetical protein